MRLKIIVNTLILFKFGIRQKLLVIKCEYNFSLL